jgi:two-component system, NtrC family, sensor kinase
MAGTVVRENRQIHLPDLDHLEGEQADWPGVVVARRTGIRTMVGTPLRTKDRCIGALMVYRNVRQPFEPAELQLLQSFADQAAIAIENARLFESERQGRRELAESLEQQTATAEVLRVISSSPGDLDPVFAAMLEKAVAICEAKFGNIYRWNGDALHLVATCNTPPAFAEARRYSALKRPGALTVTGRTLATKAVVHVADAAEQPGYADKSDPAAVAAVELGGARTILAVPMMKEAELIGSFTVYRQQVRPFTDKQVALLESFAAQAVIAIENARLLTELRESLERQTATSEVLGVISSAPGDLESVFNSMLENANRICAADFGVMFLYENDFWRPVGLRSTPAEFAWGLLAEPRRWPAETGLGRLAASKQLVRIDDVRADSVYQVQRDPSRVAFVEIAGARTFVAVPMLKEDKLIGAFCIFHREVRPFTDKQIKLVQNFAAQAVIAIENARLLAELRSRTDELGRSVGELRALGEVSQAVNSTLDLENVLETIVAKAVQLSGTAAGAIYVFDDASREFHLRATYGMDRGLIEALSKQHIGLDESNIALAMTGREPVQVADLRDEPPNPINDIVLRAGFCARLTAPLFPRRSDRRHAGGASAHARRVRAKHRRSDQDVRRAIGCRDPERAAIRERGDAHP